MADGGDPPKKDNPRYEALTRGSGHQYYLAARYFNKTPEQWDAQPWWLSVCYLDGLEAQGVIGDKEHRQSPNESGPGTTLNTDMTGDLEGLAPGFKTRRAG